MKYKCDTCVNQITTEPPYSDVICSKGCWDLRIPDDDKTEGYNPIWDDCKSYVYDVKYPQHRMLKVLTKAQDTYGYSRQFSVVAEECCELAQVACKYPRYDNHDEAMKDIRDDLVKECADVVIVLHHLYTMCGITPEEVQTAMDGKLARLERWLDNSDSMQETTRDREVNKEV